MERREAVKYISLLLGGTLVGGTAFLTGCKSETGKNITWTINDTAYLDEIAETILPETSIPGAKAAKVGDFMKIMVNDCYEEGDQDIFIEGMNQLNKESIKKFDEGFMDINPEQRKELLIAIDTEAKTHQQELKKFNDEENKKQKEDPAYKKKQRPQHYFNLMKQLTLLGYFTSEIGATQALGYVSVPGRFDACIDYEKGKRWA